MSATNALETAVLKKLFTGVEDTLWTAIEAAANFYISLHTADPGEAGSQTSGETTYTGYARIAVTRDTDGWTVTDDSAVNDAEVTFGQCTADPGSNITHAAIGLDLTGAGTLLLRLTLDDPVVMQVGTVPIFAIGELEGTVD